MENELRRIIAKIAEVQDVNFPLDADLRDELDVDSHRVVELAFEIEQSFGVSIPISRMEELRTLRASIALVTALKDGAA
jgi:acyl carrier protein